MRRGPLPGLLRRLPWVPWCLPGPPPLREPGLLLLRGPSPWESSVPCLRERPRRRHRPLFHLDRCRLEDLLLYHLLLMFQWVPLLFHRLFLFRWVFREY